MLFERDRVVAVLDLDFMAERDRIDDIALILYYTNSGTTLARGLPIEDRRKRLRALVDAYDSTAVPALGSIERVALPLALARTMLKYTRYLVEAEVPAQQRGALTAELPELSWSEAILHQVTDWQDAFA